MSMENPQALLLLLGLVPLGFVFFADLLHSRKALESLEKFGLQSIFRTTVFFKWFVSLFLFVLFYLLMTLALCGISWGEKPVEDDRRNLDLVFVIDVSRSMLAADSSPNRLERSISIVQDIMEGLPTARVALVAFKGRAIPLIPLTNDHSALENALVSLSPSIGTARGTRPESGLESALGLFLKGSNRHRMVVFLSDGEGFGPPVSALARTAGADGIPIICVGLGTEAGSHILLPDGSMVQDSGGNPVQTRLDSAALKNIAQSSGGSYVPDASDDIPAKIVLNELQTRVDQSETSGFRLVAVDRRTIFVLAAVGVLGLFVWFRSLRWKGIV